MKAEIHALLQQALKALGNDGILEAGAELNIPVERGRDDSHGDFASPVALALARSARCNPRQLAEQMVERLPDSPLIEKTEIAGPGFINFTIRDSAYQMLVSEILKADEHYGSSKLGAEQRLQVEFVSANPTGPLHVGHGRGAAYGAVVANLLRATGHKVECEYYVNDAGRQMDILAASVWLRYLQGCGETLPFPSNGYRGAYIQTIADELRSKHGEEFRLPANTVVENLPPDEADGGDKELYIDSVIERARTLLGERRYRLIHGHVLAALVEEIRCDLLDFGIGFEHWYSERSLMDSGSVTTVIERLREAGHLYEREGALWFRSTEFDDKKDRVVVRENGQTTYFASDIAYHLDKFERGFTRVINVWGADHHGYVPRVRAALQALQEDPARLDVLLVQFANLYRGGEKVAMSTRSGDFVTLRQLREEVGRDAARFFYVMRKSDQHLDFDLDLAKAESNDNPVYYIQYAHARIASVMRQTEEKGFRWRPADSTEVTGELGEDHELVLLRRLSRYPEIVEAAALAYEPHQLAYYLRELANDFHTYYNAHIFLVAEAPLRNARLGLINATRIVLRNGLALLGVSAPDTM